MGSTYVRKCGLNARTLLLSLFFLFYPSATFNFTVEVAPQLCCLFYSPSLAVVVSSRGKGILHTYISSRKAIRDNRKTMASKENSWKTGDLHCKVEGGPDNRPLLASTHNRFSSQTMGGASALRSHAGPSCRRRLSGCFSERLANQLGKEDDESALSWAHANGVV